MNFGASIACFYPMDTELSLRKIGELGIKNTEIFFNTFSELEVAYFNTERNKIFTKPGEIRYDSGFYSFEEKYSGKSRASVKPCADVPSDIAEASTAYSGAITSAIGI